jgi:hypothetical protein
MQVSWIFTIVAVAVVTASTTRQKANPIDYEEESLIKNNPRAV